MASSLGIIETRGFVPAVEAADAAVKTAAVTLLGCRFAGAGLVSIFLTGDVSSVRSAVHSGVTSAARLCEVVSSTVIGRMADDLEFIFAEVNGNDPAAAEAPEQEEQRAVSRLPKDRGTGSPADLPTVAELTRLSVNRLRSIARSTANLTIGKADIKFAHKEQLIAAIIAARPEKNL